SRGEERGQDRLAHAVWQVADHEGSPSGIGQSVTLSRVVEATRIRLEDLHVRRRLEALAQRGRETTIDLERHETAAPAGKVSGQGAAARPDLDDVVARRRRDQIDDPLGDTVVAKEVLAERSRAAPRGRSSTLDGACVPAGAHERAASAVARSRVSAR